jgi:hypothetical protein
MAAFYDEESEDRHPTPVGFSNQDDHFYGLVIGL